MQLTIILSKEVDTVEQGQKFYDVVKVKLERHPEIKMQGKMFVPIVPVNTE